MQRHCLTLPMLILAWAGTVTAQITPKSNPRTANGVQALSQLSTSLEQLTRTVSPSVVQIIASGYALARSEEGSVTTETQGGSGIIVDAEGYIVTNAHVAEGAQKIRVLLAGTASAVEDVDGPILEDGNAVPARLVGVDSETDLAVLKIDRPGLKPLKLADSSRLQQGEIVLAFGSPMGLENTVSMGIVSAVARQLKPESIMAYIQTDAPINPGNSGGPLVNTRGEVIGINTLILTQSGGNEGLGFAIPSNVVANAYKQIRKDGHVHHGYIGVTPRAVDALIAKGLSLPVRKGVILEDVSPHGPADEAGLKPGDVIVGIDGNAIADPRKIGTDISHRLIGDTIRLEVWRGKEKLEMPVTISERPDDPNRFADVVKKDSSLIREFAVLAFDVSDKVAPLLPTMRRPAGVAVAARVKGMPGPSDEFETGDLISSVNTEPVLNIVGLRKILSQLKPGDPVVVRIQREDDFLLIAFELP